MSGEARTRRNVHALANAVLHNAVRDPELRPAAEKEIAGLGSLSGTERDEILAFADSHHVIVRFLAALQTRAAQQNSSSARHQSQFEWINPRLNAESDRIETALKQLSGVCAAIEKDGDKVVVIKSLDHWPDMGSDLDLFTTAHPKRLEQVMVQTFNAAVAERSWGDRLGNKWNFQIPNLPQLIEVHVRYLGQTGEHQDLAKRVVERRVIKAVGGRTFHVPAPEERVMISTLQRMYRHFYFRLCDMVDTALLVRSKAIDFGELERAAKAGGIWPGVEAFLLLVFKYVASFGEKLDLPANILCSPSFSEVSVRLENGFLRVPKFPAAGLYGKQLLTAGVHRDFRAMFRLPLLPPLAISALVAYHFTGSDKGIW